MDLLDEDGRAFSLVVTGAADNCSLSHGVFTRVREADRGRQGRTQAGRQGCCKQTAPAAIPACKHPAAVKSACFRRVDLSRCKPQHDVEQHPADNCTDVDNRRRGPTSAVMCVLQVNMDRLQLVPPAGGVHPLPLCLADAAYEMPLDEAVGPLHLTPVRPVTLPLCSCS